MKIPALPITINGKVFDDYRDLFAAVHDFGHTTDFTYRDEVTEDIDQFFAHFLASQYLDENLAHDAMYEEYKDESDEVKEEIVKVYMNFDVLGQLPVGLIPKN